MRLTRRGGGREAAAKRARLITVSRPLPLPLKPSVATLRPGDTMNRFDREFWDGAREAALAIYTYINGRNDVPADVRQLVEQVLAETGERKNRDFREAIGVASPRARA